MRKKRLEKDSRMNAATFVEHASLLAGKMVSREMRGSGDTENAMRRLEALRGIPYATLWALRYRRPKSIAADIYARIVAAYDHECDRQQQLLEHERAITKAKGAFAAALIRAAASLDSEEG